MDLDEHDDVVWRKWTKGPVGTLAGAFDLVSRDGTWVLFVPIFVHREYSEDVWQRVQARANGLAPEHARAWERRSSHWKDACEGST